MNTNTEIKGKPYLVGAFFRFYGLDEKYSIQINIFLCQSIILLGMMVNNSFYDRDHMVLDKKNTQIP